MSHFGIICPPLPGHLNPTASLGRELVQRGHRVTVFDTLDIEIKVRSEGLEFSPVGLSSFPPGTLAQFQKQMGEFEGLACARFALQMVRRVNAMRLEDTPTALLAAGVDALLVDDGEPVGATIAQHLGLPQISIGCALPGHREPAVPPDFTPWAYAPGGWAQLRNRLGFAAYDWLTRAIAADIRHKRRQWQLPAYRNLDESLSPLAQISQLPRAFDYPRQTLPAHFHYVGPLVGDRPQDTPFPYERLDGRPLIYASLGTIQNHRPQIFRTIAQACDGLDAQLVLTLGGGSGKPEDYPGLPGNPVVVGYAPQLELLKRASLTITHAGLNTTLESLSNGVPMVATPIATDQPGVAARIAWSGTGEVVPLAQLEVGRLRQAVKTVLQEDSYRSNARRLKSAIEHGGGVTEAADIVEAVLRTRKPVLAGREKTVR